MKKKLFFSILTACFLLVSCNSRPVADRNNEPQFEEDTYAHDELFDNVKMLDNYGGDSSDDPAIGIQATPVVNDKISIRFIGAIRVEEGKLGDTTAVWERGMFAYPSGTAIKAYANKPSQKAYTVINAGIEDPYTIGDYNTDHGTSYTHFVTYILKDIPYTTYANAVLNVTLTTNISGEEDAERKSKSIVTSIDGSVKFSFNGYDEGYIGIKKVAGGFEEFQVMSAYPSDTYGGAAFEANIGNNESFIIIYKTSSVFRVFGYNNVDLAEGSYERDGDSQFVIPESTKTLVFMRGEDVEHTVMVLRNYNNNGPVFDDPTNPKIVVFGKYPQTYVKDSTTIAALNAKQPSEANSDTGWYTYNGSEYENLNAAPRNLGNNVPVFSDGGSIVNGASYWFKVEPVFWKVLEVNENHDTFKLLSTVLLDATTFNSTEDYYENSSVKQYIDGNFRGNIFYGVESFALSMTLPGISFYRNANYGFNPSTTGSTRDPNRVCKGTDYAKAKGLMGNKQGGYYWTGGSLNTSVYYISNQGMIATAKSTSIGQEYWATADFGIRPWIELNL